MTLSKKKNDRIEMPPRINREDQPSTSRRITRSATRGVVESQEKKPSRSTNTVSSNKEDFKKLLVTKPTVQKLKIFLGEKPKAYLIPLELWKDYLMVSIQAKHMDVFDYYVTINEKIMDKPDFVYFLNAMRKANIEDMFTKKTPFWTLFKLKTENPIYPHQGILNVHIEDALTDKDEAYVSKFIKHKWTLFLSSELFESGINCSNNFLDTLASYMVHTSDANQFSTNHLTEYSRILRSAEDFDIKLSTYLLSRFIYHSRSIENIDLSFANEEVLNHFKIYNDDTIFTLPLIKIILLCLEQNYTDVLNEILLSIDLNTPKNQRWLSFMFDYYISNAHLSQGRKEEIESILLILHQANKFNVNNIYLEISQTITGTLAFSSRIRVIPEWGIHEPLGQQNGLLNPYLWMDKNIPVLAYALMFKNIRAIKFLYFIGATFKRCAFTMADVARNDPELLKLFHLEKSLVKTQRSIKEKLYRPSNKNPFYQKLIHKWNEHLSE